MRKFGILGYPLGHTMSPPIHQKLFELSCHESDYDVLEIPPERLTEELPRLRALDGFNVTIPHKVELLHLVDHLDESALRYRAVNVVARDQSGALTGYNTDCYGFLKTMAVLGAELTRSVCVLGAGGVGRMFAIEAALQGAQVTLAVRESGKALAEQVRAEILAQRPAAVVTLADIAALRGDYHLLINATPVGMYPKVDALPVDPAFLQGCEFVFDSVYNPTVTKLLRTAAQAGCRVAGGMDMLVWQAVKAHEYWDNAVYRTADITALIAEMTALVDQKF